MSMSEEPGAPAEHDGRADGSWARDALDALESKVAAEVAPGRGPRGDRKDAVAEGGGGVAGDLVADVPGSEEPPD